MGKSLRAKACELGMSLVASCLFACAYGAQYEIEEGGGGAGAGAVSDEKNKTEPRITSSETPKNDGDASHIDARVTSSDAEDVNGRLDMPNDDSSSPHVETPPELDQCPPSPPPEPFFDCPEACTGGCEPSTGTCIIVCDEKEACKGDELRCPLGLPCIVRCSGEQSCETSRLLCPATQPCRIECVGKVGCKAAQIVCQDGPCDIECQLDGCHDTVISCGAGACRTSCPGEAPRTQTCNDSCQCLQC